MRLRSTIALATAVVVCLLGSLCAQDLAPRAYVITPVHTNAVTLTYSLFDGDIVLEGAAPITDSGGRVNVSTLSVFHTMNLLGRSSNLTVSLPYGAGNFHGTVLGSETNVYRSGLFDAVFRLAVNLTGGPAMTVEEFRSWRQRTIVGASLKVVAPTGQYDPTKLINYGTGRWAFKPEVGLSRRRGHWIIDAYSAVWLFAGSPEFFSRNAFVPGTQYKTQAPIGAFEGHLSYDVRPRFWVSLDGNFWFGGRTSLNGVDNPSSLQTNSRVGATASVPVSQHHSVKFSYNRGAYVRFGGAYQNISIGWQYSWLGRPQ